MGRAFSSGFEGGIAPALGAVMPEECVASVAASMHSVSLNCHDRRD